MHTLALHHLIRCLGGKLTHLPQLMQAKPALAKLKRTLTACAVLLVSCAGSLALCISSDSDADGVYGKPHVCFSRAMIGIWHATIRRLNSSINLPTVNFPSGRGASRQPTITANGIIYSDKVRSVDQLLYDDEAAASEAAAAGNRPAYCGDRYFKSLAGGEAVCAKFKS